MIKKYCLIILLAMASSSSLSAGSVGVNLDAVNYWTPSIPFADAMRMADRWVIDYKKGGGAPSDDIEYDANGYPLALTPFDDGENGLRDRVAIAYVLLGNYDESTGSARAPTGNYILTWDGDGSISWGHHKSAAVFASEAVTERRIVRDYTDIGRGFHVRINKTNPLDPVRNVKLMLPGYEGLGKTFTDWAIADAKNYSAIRYMDWKQVNFSFESTWTDRVSPAYVFQGMQAESQYKHRRERYRGDAMGVSWEYVIEFANSTGTDPWITIPIMVDDDYVVNLASLLKSTLNPDLKLYVEYGNEIWNSGTFPAYSYCKEQGVARGYLGDSGNVLKDESLASFRFQGARSVEIFDIFDAEFGVDARERIVRVMAGQATSPSVLRQSLDFEYAPSEFVRDKVDALSIAPYIGHKVISDLFESAPVVDEVSDTSAYTYRDITNGLLAALRNDTKSAIDGSAALAAEYGKSLIAYEGGQHLDNNTGDTHLTSLMIEAQYSDEMRSIYDEYLGYWFNNVNGGLFAHYTNISPCSKFGCWGAKQFYDQTHAESKKLAALVDAASGLAPATPAINDALVVAESTEMCAPIYDINDDITGSDTDIIGSPITYAIEAGVMSAFGVDSYSGQVYVTDPKSIKSESVISVVANNGGVSVPVNLTVLAGAFEYEDITTWSLLNRVTVEAVGPRAYKITKGSKEYAAAKLSLGVVPVGGTVRVVFNADVVTSKQVTVKVSPYFGFADTGGHVVMGNGNQSYDVLYKNATGAEIANATMSIGFEVGAEYAADSVVISDMLIIRGSSK